MRLSELSGQNFVLYERTYAPGFHDLIFGMLRDARIVQYFPDGAELSMLRELWGFDRPWNGVNSGWHTKRFLNERPCQFPTLVSGLRCHRRLPRQRYV